MARRKTPQRDPVEEGKALSNTSRNERQKSVLLCEAARLGREQVDKLVRDSKGLVESSKFLVEESWKLCEKANPNRESRGKRRA